MTTNWKNGAVSSSSWRPASGCGRPENWDDASNPYGLEIWMETGQNLKIATIKLYRMKKVAKVRKDCPY